MMTGKKLSRFGLAWAALVFVLGGAIGCGGGSGGGGGAGPGTTGWTGEVDPQGGGDVDPGEHDGWIEALTASKNGNQVTLTWQLAEPGDEIVVYRGSAELATIGGTATSHVIAESDFGYYRYTVALFVGGRRVDTEGVLVDLGRSVWDAPAGGCTGFFVYVAEAIGDPYSALPYDNPMDFSCDAGSCLELPLKSLYDDALITGGKTYYLAASSYVGNPVVDVSALTAPVTFSYKVVIDAP